MKCKYCGSDSLKHEKTNEHDSGYCAYFRCNNCSKMTYEKHMNESAISEMKEKCDVSVEKVFYSRIWWNGSNRRELSYMDKVQVLTITFQEIAKSLEIEYPIKTDKTYEKYRFYLLANHELNGVLNGGSMFYEAY